MINGLKRLARRLRRSRAVAGSTNRRLRVHIGHHFFGAGNVGDDLMLGGFLAVAESCRVPIDLTCCIPHDPASQRLRFPQVTWLPYDPETRRDAISACDAWLGLGDTPFQTRVGDWLYDHLLEESEYCARAGKAMYYLAVGVEDAAAAAHPKARELVARAAAIWTRDAASHAALDEVADPTKLRVGADLAHPFLQGRPSRPVEGGTLGLVLAMEDPTALNLGAIASLVGRADGARWLVQEQRELPGGEWVLLKQVQPQLGRDLDVRAIDYLAAPLDSILEAWGTSGTLVTSRYHATLAGAWWGARVVVINRSQKLRGAVQDLGVVQVEPAATTEELERAIAEARPVARDRLEALALQSREACHAFFASVK